MEELTHGSFLGFQQVESSRIHLSSQMFSDARSACLMSCGYVNGWGGCGCASFGELWAEVNVCIV